jgi:hypothetical protein
MRGAWDTARAEVKPHRNGLSAPLEKS